MLFMIQNCNEFIQMAIKKLLFTEVQYPHRPQCNSKSFTIFHKVKKSKTLAAHALVLVNDYDRAGIDSCFMN